MSPYSTRKQFPFCSINKTILFELMLRKRAEFRNMLLNENEIECKVKLAKITG